MTGDDWLDYCGDRVKRDDRDRLMCALIAPAERRPVLLALLAFDLEIAAIAPLVSEPVLGEIRLQWWRDALASVHGGEIVDHPVLRGLSRGIERHGLSRCLFEAYLDGRSLELNGEALEDTEALEAYLDKTAGGLAELMAEGLGLRELPLEQRQTARRAVRHAGLAWGLARLLGSRRGRAFLPGEGGAAVGARVTHHIAEARSLRRAVPTSMLPVMATVILAEDGLRRHARHGHGTGVGRLFGFAWRVLCKRY